MRNEFDTVLKEELRVLAIQTRERLDLTQKEMSEELLMNETSYSDIETGKYKCGTLTAILLLLKQPDPTQALQRFEQKFRARYDKELHLV